LVFDKHEPVEIKVKFFK
jgi:hypothetical protein